MKKQRATENRFRKKEITRQFRNDKRKGNTTAQPFKERVKEDLKPEFKENVKSTSKDCNGTRLNKDDICKYRHGERDIIIKLIGVDLTAWHWSGKVHDVQGFVLDNCDSGYYSDDMIITVEGTRLEYLENYIEPEKTYITINKNSLENMIFIKYNKFTIEGIDVDYSYITSIRDSNISCGVKQYSVINSLFDFLKFQYMFVKKYHIFTFEITKEDFYKIFCKKVMDNIFNTYRRAGFLIISTNETDNPVFSEINDLLTSYDFISSKDTINPNTRNNIRFWTCDLFTYQKTLPPVLEKEVEGEDRPMISSTEMDDNDWERLEEDINILETQDAENEHVVQETSNSNAEW